MLLDDIGQIKRRVFLGGLNVGVAHYLLEGAQVAALHQEILTEGVADAVGPQLRPLDARFLHVPADYGVDEVSSNGAFVTVEYVVVWTKRSNLEEKAPCLLGNRHLAPAHFAANDYGLLFDVVLEERAHLASAHTIVHYQGEYCPVPWVLRRVKQSHQLIGFKGWHEGFRTARWLNGIHRVGQPATAADELEEGLQGAVDVPPSSGLPWTVAKKHSIGSGRRGRLGQDLAKGRSLSSYHEIVAGLRLAAMRLAMNSWSACSVLMVEPP